MLYLDNAATTFPKPRSVTKEVRRCIEKYCGNPSRGAHFYSLRAGEEIYLSRERIAEYFGISEPERVVFTENATYALNIAIKCLIKTPCNIMISDLEHNSVLRPIVKLCESEGFSFSVFSTKKDLGKSLEEAVTPDTGAIVCTLASNVSGATLSQKLISDFAKRHKLISIVDSSQLAGHKSVDLKETPFTALCAPAHKALYGIQGAGFAIFDKSYAVDTLIEGGSGSDSRLTHMPIYLPERLEGGTLPTPSIVALRKGIEFINERGQENIRRHIDGIADRFEERLKRIGNIEIFRGECGIISFRINGVPCDALAEKLGDLGICIRNGLHCSPLAHKTLGTIKTGLLRISISALNRSRDADLFYTALKNALY